MSGISSSALWGQSATQASAEASAKPPATTISVDVKLVNLPVTVRDKHGQIVRDLTKDDFNLEEDGRPETIKYFAQETNLPLTLGLLVDTSLSQRNVLNEERTASKSFLDRMLTNEKDRAFLIHFDREVELLEDLTSSKEKLEKALESMSAPTFKRDPQDDPNDRSGGPHYGGGTLLYDAVYLASNELMKKQTGRKAVIILSDGVDRGSKESLESAIEAAQRAETLVYSILFKDENHGESGEHHSGMGHGGVWPGGGGGGWPGGGSGGGRHGGGGGGRRPQEAHVDGKKILQRISEETGGRMFEVSKKETIEQIYASIGEELRTKYNLAYTPVKIEGGAEGYHKISLTAKKKDLNVQTRLGYYAAR